MPTLISDKKKYIFIHIPKCAGTSISSYIGNYEKKSYFIKLFNYLLRKTGIKQKIFFNKYSTNFMFPHFINDHEKAREIREIIGKNIYDDYFKFCFIRNPWARSVSRYNYFNSISKSKISFKNYLLKDFQPQKERISDSKGNIIVDFIGRYENFEDDFKKVLNKINISYKKEKLQHFHKTQTAKDYKTYYDQECFNIIKNKYYEDIEFFKYKF